MYNIDRLVTETDCPLCPTIKLRTACHLVSTS